MPAALAEALTILHSSSSSSQPGHLAQPLPLLPCSLRGHLVSQSSFKGNGSCLPLQASLLPLGLPHLCSVINSPIAGSGSTCRAQCKALTPPQAPPQQRHQQQQGPNTHHQQLQQQQQLPQQWQHQLPGMYAHPGHLRSVSGQSVAAPGLAPANTAAAKDQAWSPTGAYQFESPTLRNGAAQQLSPGESGRTWSPVA